MEDMGLIPTAAGHLRDEKVTGDLQHHSSSSMEHRSNTMATTMATVMKVTLAATLDRILGAPMPNNPTTDEVNHHHNNITKIPMRQRLRGEHECQMAEAGSILPEEEEAQPPVVAGVHRCLVGHQAQALAVVTSRPSIPEVPTTETPTAADPIWSSKWQPRSARAKEAKVATGEAKTLAVSRSKGGEDRLLHLNKMATRDTMMGTVDDRRLRGLGMSSPLLREMYPQDSQGYDYNTYSGGGGYDGNQGYAQQPSRASFGDAHDEYQCNGGQQGYQAYGAHAKGPSASSLPNFEMIPPASRGSFEQTMRPGPGPMRPVPENIRPGPEIPQPGAHQTAKLNHAKSQPDLRQPQTAIFEMAGDIPSVPPIPPTNSLPPQVQPSQGYGAAPMAHERMPQRGPSAPPGPVNMPAPKQMGPSPARSEPPIPPPASQNPDALPSHPTPVRAGLMANSMVSLNEKPPPVRNYGGVPQSQPQLQQRPQPQQEQRQPQPPVASSTRPVELPVTPQELEHLRMVIKNNPNDQASALRLAKKLIEAADVLLPNVPDPKARGRARERYVMDAHKILKKLSNAQNVDAMFTMADAYGRGLFGGDSDAKEAFTLYQSAAKLGHASAAYRTAVCCEIGHEEGGGTRKDPMKAVQWYKRAASLGDTPAMYKVGMIQLKGLLGQPRNPREAVGWLKRAAERADSENPHALHELGLLYESARPNDTIIRDERYAASLFQQAADLGYKFSQFRLGQAYEYGSMGFPVDARMSIMWYSKAAQREEHQAELALSGWYLTGSDGVLKQSDQEAYLWARKAAVAGLAKAEYAMGYFTEVGIGVPANLEDAKRWYWRAAAQDFPKARERLEDLKRGGNRAGPRREQISRSRIEKHGEGECSIM
ncbi:Chitin synthase regulatory factor-like protein [Emericellopsis cladophorae]|uniref:Chitin synthase regulatory factor-like protein n=1 Tax=Emericellopsis cladophorae TaxID=2686198 RepID=A0A9P9XZ05_9HYPO|nr:Chitin synthase regulatory factor-like protein [Emericellopsis cladophorae]KAI6780060.1 Chitin synthase regulatory factor-like protein [Emericellopsis cladophorae]